MQPSPVAQGWCSHRWEEPSAPLDGGGAAVLSLSSSEPLKGCCAPPPADSPSSCLCCGLAFLPAPKQRRCASPHPSCCQDSDCDLPCLLGPKSSGGADGSSTRKGFVQGLQENADGREEITFNPTKERGLADLAALTT